MDKKKNRKISRREFVVTGVTTTLGATGGLVLLKSLGCASGKILVGRGNQFTTIQQEHWEQDMSAAPQLLEAELKFMSEEHHLVRNLVVRELPNIGEPLSPERIARMSNLSVTRVNVILDELEKNLTFLFRNDQGAVEWAYPVTTSHTPHHATFSTGEKVYAA